MHATGLRLIAACCFVGLGVLRCDGELRVRSDFPGGNAEVVSLDQESSVLRIMPEIRPGRGWPCWWFLRVEGLKAGQKFTLEVQAQTQPYRDKTVLNAAWCQPKHAAVSYDGSEWQLSPAAEFTADKIARYRFQVSSESLAIAWGPPFLPADAEQLLARLAAQLPDAVRFDLAESRDGRKVQGIRIGREEAVHQVWVNARQHAWEAGGSWVGKGFIEWIAGDAPEARQLRQEACIHFVPIMDIDNVAVGAGGKDAQPRDHNRDWSEQPIYPEVAAAQQRIQEIIKRRGLAVYVDLHNPGANDPTFFFGPFDLEQMQGTQQRNYQRWIELAAERIVEPMRVEPRYRVASYVTSDEERRRMSSQWVRDQAGDAALSVTLETRWNAPMGSQAGYGQIGAGLAQTLAAYIAQDPKASVPEPQ